MHADRSVMSTSQFALDYAEYEALLAERFETALTVVGQSLTVRFAAPSDPARPEPCAPRATIDNHQQRQDALRQTLTLRSWANALPSDAH
jgi:hypothetical protein